MAALWKKGALRLWRVDKESLKLASLWRVQADGLFLVFP